MKSFAPVFLALFVTASALPAQQAGPVRILPSCWGFEIVSLKGPGCRNDTSSPFTTRVTYGSNTVDGSEIYYWHAAYPEIVATVGAGVHEASIYCESVVKYTEYKDCKETSTAANYRLKFQKNGTEVLANYKLDEGVTAKWSFTYYPQDEDEVVDEIVVPGPYTTGNYGQMLQSPVPKDPVRWTLPHCGSGFFKFRTDLKVTADKRGANGTVNSETVTYQGAEYFYGVQPGWSYDFELCSN